MNEPLTVEHKRKISETCKKRGVGKWMKGRIQKGNPKITKNCLVCGESFKIWVSSIVRGQGLFCSTKCRGINQTNEGVIVKSCIICSKQFNVSGSQKTGGYGKFCSMYCYGLSKRSPAYKDDEAIKTRRSPEYRKWRKSVFERDDYTCQWCGMRGKTLNADHIKPFSYYPELRLNLDNGRTLCKPCHMKTDTWGGRKKPMTLLSLQN